MNDWVRLLQPYEQAVEELKVKFKAIRDQYRELSEYSPIEFTTGRVKKISSIIEKSKRLGMPLSKVEEEMEDIAGIRIMCQFIDDIYVVVEHIKSRDGKDFRVMYEKDYIQNPKESGYKSYHMILKYPVYTASGAREILAEIQIRTLAMNFWATIEHSLNYKYKQQIPEQVLARLRSAALAATQLDEEMMAISKEVKKAQIDFEEKSNIVKDITAMIKYLYDAGHTELAETFSLRFDSLNSADSVIELQYLHWEMNRHLKKIQKEEAGE